MAPKAAGLGFSCAFGKASSTGVGDSGGMIQRRHLAAVAAATLFLPSLAHAAEDKKPKGSFLAIAGLAATVIRTDGGHGVMTVEAGIDIPDPVQRAYADSVQPRLRDAYAMAIQAYAGGLTPGTLPDPDYLGRKLQAATDATLGKPGGKLLIGGLMIN